MTQTLGRLVRVELRDIWKSEATDFTPWLARDENLNVLAETLALNLEVEATERPVGPFRADILCKDLANDSWVLIENQLEKTDHTHLGQLLTYASGLEAVTIVWIAASFTEEHRSTLDWLNRITDTSFRFFGLEVELWKIGESPAAPKFNIVSKPNDWSKAVHKAAQAIDDSELSETKLLQRDYWDAFHTVLEAQRGPISGQRTPQAQNWMNYPVGRTGFVLATVMQIWEKYIRAELYITGAKAKDRFAQLEEMKSEIEAELGYKLFWDLLPAGQDCRITVTLDASPEDRDDWTRQHQWLAQKLNELHSAFSERVRRLA
ncbi:DUF4268 domain-containing protein [Altererythrobacter sp. GH1-8]|uniref:DUF4268 domain-containing protein n=1 Tax=Altererythrobacter sp. GH1-8 TaxID=3349333 RepID=UPI00374D9D9E